MRKINLIFSLFFATILKAQLVIDFENFNFPNGQEFDNGKESPNVVEGFFVFNPLKFPNNYNDEWNFWSSGWAISSVKDSITPGFLNMYAARPGGAASGNNYAVGQQNANILYEANGNSSLALNFLRFQITNSTYAALSMRDGDQFAKKFGGESGDDPDYFFVRVSLLLNGVKVAEDDVYLADYRFENNALDYILTEWKEVEFSGNVYDEVKFQIFSSDTGAFGINTPTFFCLDKIELGFNVGLYEAAVKSPIQLFPNPAKEAITIKLENQKEQIIQIIELSGRVVRTMQVVGQQTIDVHDLVPGIYLVRGERGSVSRFVKQ